MKNPGYHIKVYQDCEMRFMVKPIDYINKSEPPSVSVCILEVAGDRKYDIILEDDNYASRAWGYYTQ